MKFESHRHIAPVNENRCAKSAIATNSNNNFVSLCIVLNYSVMIHRKSS